MIQRTPLVFTIPTTIPAHSLKEFIVWCSVPTNRCSWGSGTVSGQLVGKQLLSLAGLKDATHVPYKGTAPMTTDLLGGHISMGITSISSGQPHYRSGKLRFLAVSSRDRFPSVSEVPTLGELGYKVYQETWYGLMVAKATPPPVVAAIASAVQAASKDTALRAAIDNSGVRAVFDSPEEFTRYVQTEIEELDPLLAKFPLGDR
jgi:tripartite-type tricarboxylate transporter receptor subunit TctC